ncbi:hypothetical protein QBC34DRAFT_387906 [Podospora aff. communis PSN243]|uniref:C2H2-type domain-containing protein n=1 Tax=Podospora aff. communis PSN243 TaxID=3040156 RepID=A0AAV9H549_9PEZI|nr:hypothetical protein QBC34DRAFT_387906 [Podospora aff. communis PSN243]
MKRNAEDDGPEASSKKLLAEWPQDDDIGSAETASIFSAADSSAASTAHPAQTAPATSITATSTASRKFPSDLKTIKCTFPGCPKTFNRPARLAAHLRSHTNDRAFRCPYEGCGKDYLEEKHLAQHIKGSHTHEKKYTCEEPGCGKSFVTATRLRRHAAVHEGAERFRCRGYEGCDQSFRKHQTLQRHIRTTHLDMAAYVCSQKGCSSGFDTAAALRRHVEREHGELKFWCDECGKGDGEGEGQRVGFTTLLQLQTHMRKEHVGCMFCDVKCNGQADLERHIDLYHSGTTVEDRKTVACTWEACGKTFTRVSNLNTHIKSAHEGVRFVCGQVDTFGVEDISDWNWMEEGCGQSFVSKLKLEEHVRFVHLAKPRPPKLYTISTKSSTEIEEMTGVLSNRTIACTVADCPVRFARHADLNKHLERDHINHFQGITPIDPLLEQQSGADSEHFWLLPGEPEPTPQLNFETEWAEMRRLIDLDSLAEG